MRRLASKYSNVDIESAIISMIVRTRHPLRLLVLALFTTFASFSSLAQDPSVSIIQTIAGSEDDNIVGTEFSFGGIAGLAVDSIGNTPIARPNGLGKPAAFRDRSPVN